MTPDVRAGPFAWRTGVAWRRAVEVGVELGRDVQREQHEKRGEAKTSVTHLQPLSESVAGKPTQAR